MSRLVALDSRRHARLKLAPGSSLEFAARQHVVNLRAAEIGRAVSSFPVFVNRSAISGGLLLSAVTSLEPGINLFVEDGQWTAVYQPTALQTFPFDLLRTQGNPDDFVVGIDESSDAFSESSGEALFDENGKASLFLTRITAQLRADIENDLQTVAFTQRLDELGLVKAIDVLVRYEDGRTQTVQGLQTIDEDRLKSLAAAELLELNGNGYLLSLHAMLVSIHQLNRLVRRHNRRPELEKVAQVKLQIARNAADPQ